MRRIWLGCVATGKCPTASHSPLSSALVRRPATPNLFIRLRYSCTSSGLLAGAVVVTGLICWSRRGSGGGGRTPIARLAVPGVTPGETAASVGAGLRGCIGNGPIRSVLPERWLVGTAGTPPGGALTPAGGCSRNLALAPKMGSGFSAAVAGKRSPLVVRQPLRMTVHASIENSRNIIPPPAIVHHARPIAGSQGYVKQS